MHKLAGIVVAAVVGVCAPVGPARAQSSAGGVVRVENPQISPLRRADWARWMSVELQLHNGLDLPVTDVLLELRLANPRGGEPVTLVRRIGRVVPPQGRLSVRLTERITRLEVLTGQPTMQAEVVDFRPLKILKLGELIKLSRGNSGDRGVARRIAQHRIGSLAMLAARRQEEPLLAEGALAHELLHELRLSEPVAQVKAAEVASAAQRDLLADALVHDPGTEGFNPSVTALLELVRLESARAELHLLRTTPSQAAEVHAGFGHPSSAVRFKARQILDRLVEDPEVAQTVIRWCAEKGLAPLDGPDAISRLFEREQEGRRRALLDALAAARRDVRHDRPATARLRLQELRARDPEGYEVHLDDVVSIYGWGARSLLRVGDGDAALQLLSDLPGRAQRGDIALLATEGYRLRIERAFAAGRLEEAERQLAEASHLGHADRLASAKSELARRRIVEALQEGSSWQARTLLAKADLPPKLRLELTRQLFWTSYGGLVGMGTLVFLGVALTLGVVLYRRQRLRDLLRSPEHDFSGPFGAHPYR